MRTVISLAALFLASFSATAFAAEVADGGLVDLAKPVLDAVLSGQYLLAAAAALVLAVALVRRYGGGRFPWLQSDVGGAVLALVGAYGGALATAVAAGVQVSGGLLWSALGVAVAAAGGYSMIKRMVVVPILRPLRDRAPAWARPVFDLVLWIFSRPDPAAKAGDVAVAAAPAVGATSIVGEPRDVN